ncbi:CRAL-TRIO domain-containing protein C3H8.02 isoform X2 [Asparagus officinalis]|uniref:CRAL-TRIO domain-containing protein C3H8.02 isoform X2 n=1 Tax=Asparagus officinalis TaxID=4686 RepID=UPI00098E7D49|nr:CRAL-TRIO domain-containing protein C3H8.02 isoform X2 [Asparagus officinalis]
MALRFCHPLRLPSTLPRGSPKLALRTLKCSADNQTVDTRKLVVEVKQKLELEHPYLPMGRNGRDDEDMILWFLKDRKFSVEDATAKLLKAIQWRKEFGVAELSEESVKNMYRTGKAYVHDFLDINGRPVLVVVASKHFPSKQDTSENEKLCVYMVEKAISKLPDGVEEILGIVDLRGFGVENGDVGFLKFLVRFCDVETVRKEYFTAETLPADFKI